MARWQPNAADRLVDAALHLFAERGYEKTTVTAIAEHAGLTKSTFFRHFRDKREVLSADQAMSRVLVEGIASAPSTAGPLEAVADSLDAVGRELFDPARRQLVARRQAVIAANPELQEREALKGLAVNASMAAALERRGVPTLTALLTAEIGSLALKVAYERWSDGGDFAELARRTLGELQAARPSLPTGESPGVAVPVPGQSAFQNARKR